MNMTDSHAELRDRLLELEVKLSLIGIRNVTPILVPVEFGGWTIECRGPESECEVAYRLLETGS